jgi:hypothetical protein
VLDIRGSPGLFPLSRSRTRSPAADHTGSTISQALAPMSTTKLVIAMTAEPNSNLSVQALPNAGVWPPRTLREWPTMDNFPLSTLYTGSTIRIPGKPRSLVGADFREGSKDPHVGGGCWVSTGMRTVRFGFCLILEGTVVRSTSEVNLSVCWSIVTNPAKHRSNTG